MTGGCGAGDGEEGRSRPGEGERRNETKRRKRKSPAAGAEVTVAQKYLIETFGCQMNVHDSERMAGLLEQAGLRSRPTSRRRRRRRHQHVQRPRARRRQALYAPGRAADAGAANSATTRSSRSPAAWRSRKARRILKRSAGVADVVVGTQAIRRLPMLVEQAAAAADRRRPLDRSEPVRRRHVPARRHAPRRPGEGLRHHHRGLQRILQLLRRALHARPRAHAAEGRHPGRSPRGGRQRAAAKCSCSGRS